MASMFGRFAMAQRSPAVRAAEKRALARLLQGGRRYARMAASRVRGFAVRNPQTTAFGAGAAAQVAYAARKGSKRKRMKTGIARGRKIPRRSGGGKPPTQPSSRVTAKYAVAPTMRKFKALKKTAIPKAPKGVSVHYKDFGQFQAAKCMYINHEHWGSFDRFWYTIALPLTKALLARVKIYPGKLDDDACIGPLTRPIAVDQQDIDKGSPGIIELIFEREQTTGNVDQVVNSIAFEDVTTSFDKYRSLRAIADDVKAALVSRYYVNAAQQVYWLSAARIKPGPPVGTHLYPMVYIPNLDDAVISVYTKSLLKFQNVTQSDSAGGDAFDKNAIDANPLEGRIYSSKGRAPIIDTDLQKAGNKSLDTFFNRLDTNGLTLLGASVAPDNDDLGHIKHIPPPNQLYSRGMTVQSGIIHLGVGAMKFHKTSFTMKRTFRTLVEITHNKDIDGAIKTFGKHTLFGLTMQHKHGQETIAIGFNREMDCNATVTIRNRINPVKMNVSNDEGLVVSAAQPSDLNFEP